MYRRLGVAWHTLSLKLQVWALSAVVVAGRADIFFEGLQLVKCLASTQGPKVRVNAILPGLLLTEWVSLKEKPCGLRSDANLGRQFHAGDAPGVERQSPP